MFLHRLKACAQSVLIPFCAGFKSGAYARFIPTNSGIRVISLRKANDREARKHGKPKTNDE
jgi:hypothetical protein